MFILIYRTIHNYVPKKVLREINYYYKITVRILLKPREIFTSTKIDLSSIHGNFNKTRLICEAAYKFLSLRWKLQSPGITAYLRCEFWYDPVITSPLFARHFSHSSPIRRMASMRVTFPFPLRATRINSIRATSSHASRGYANFHYDTRIMPTTINRRLIEYVDPFTPRYRARHKSHRHTSKSIAK